jgi:hypothetical protein
MKRLARVLAIGAIGGLAACGPKPSPSRVKEGDAIFYIRSNVTNASVYVDGRFIGPVGILKGGLAIVPGKHRLEVRHEDYFSRYIELDLQRAERKKLEVTLAPILP